MSISELKGEAKTWSLASDSKLLEYLQQFSAGVTDRTKSFANKVDDLSFDVSDSEVRLKNTFNDFLMLGNSQFIENVRVLLCNNSIGIVLPRFIVLSARVR
jgi:hypothetical protein